MKAYSLVSLFLLITRSNSTTSPATISSAPATINVTSYLPVLSYNSPVLTEIEIADNIYIHIYEENSTNK